MDTFGSVGTGFGTAGDRARSALTPLYNGYGSAVTASTDRLNPIFAGYGAIGDNNGLTSDQSSAMGNYGGLAGTYGDLGTAYDPNSAAYQTLRNNISKDTLASVASLGASNGRYGARSFNEGAAEGLGNALAGLDYSNMQNDINNRYRSADSQAGIYSNLFGMGQQGVGNQLAALGGQGQTASAIFGNELAGLAGQGNVANSIFANDTAALNGQQGAATSLFNAGQQGITNQQGAIDALGQIGAARDANAQGKLLGQADLFDRTKNAELDRLLKLGAAFGDPVAAANQPNWLQQGLGALLGFGGSALSGGVFGG
jgi:hypothetical protein